MNILYVSTLCSQKLIDYLYKNGNQPLQSIQKFNKLIVLGFTVHKTRITVLSSIPIDFAIIKSLGIKGKEIDNDVQYIYTKTSSIKYLHVINTFFSSFYQTLKWVIVNNKKDSVIVFDVLKVSICIGALLASKLLRIKTLAIITDIPGLMIGGKKNLYSKLSSYVNKKYINNFDLYVLLTEQMNELTNLRKRPYIIMEGLVDYSMIDFKPKEKDYPRNIIYAGGIYEKYGIKSLIDAFMMIRDDSIQLSIYGHGDLENYIRECSRKDKRVRYFGVVPNNEVVAAQLKATLLINPRPTFEDFTKYSFPSKNMEYMVSGTPLLTTALPGMPKEYYEYVYLIEDESEIGIYNMLNILLFQTPEIELIERGQIAKEFVLKNKNNVIQSKRILDLVNGQYN